MNNQKILHPIFFVLILAVSACRGNLMATSTAIPSTPTFVPTPTPTFTPTPQPVIGLTSCGKIQETGHIGDGALNMLLYSPDSRWLASASSTGVAVYDAISLSLVWGFETEANLKQIAFSADSATLTGVDVYSRIYTWQVDKGTNLLSRSPSDINELPLAFALSADGSALAIPYYDNSIRLYQTSDGILVNKLEESSASLGGMTYELAYSPDGNRLATLSFNGSISLWNIPELSLIKVFDPDKIRRPESLIFAPDGKTLAVNGETQSGEISVQMLDVHNQIWRQTFPETLISFLPDGSFVSSTGNEVILRDYKNGNSSETLPIQESIEDVFTSSPDRMYLAFGTREGIQIRKWDDSTFFKTLPAQYSNYSALALSANGLMAAVGTQGRVELRSLVDGSLIRTLETGDNTIAISSTAYSPAGNLVAATSNSFIYVWMVEDGALLWSMDTDHSVNQVAFSPDGSILAAAYSGGFSLTSGSENISQIPLWNAIDGGQLVELKGPNQGFLSGYSSLAFLPDGNSLVATEENGDVDIWSFSDGILKDTLSTDGLLTWSSILAVSPDNLHFASGAMDRQVHLWEMGSPRPLRTLDVKDGTITALAYSADGQLIAAGINDEIRLWNSNTGAFLCSIEGSSDTLTEITFTSNGRYMITLAKDGIIRIWSVP